jgi:hypothetical protein
VKAKNILVFQFFLCCCSDNFINASKKRFNGDAQEKAIYIHAPKKYKSVYTHTHTHTHIYIYIYIFLFERSDVIIMLDTFI